MSKILLKAKKGAPEFVSHGNVEVEQKNGQFRTDSREFADYLIGQGLADETTEKPASAKRRKTSSARKPKTQAAPALVEADNKPAQNSVEGESK